MKKKLIAVVAAIAIIAGGAGAYVANQPNDTASNATTAQTQTTSKIRFSVQGKQASYTGVVGQTALQTVQSLTNVDTKESSFGTMVTGIHGVVAEDGKNYWAFYVNGKYADEGAGTYKNKAGDKITWKLEDIKL